MNDRNIWAANGAPISAAMARDLLYLATGGQTGVIHPDSLTVRAQGTPNNTVRINPGGFAITATSRDAAIGYTSAPWQSYGRSIMNPVDVPIQATTSSGSRVDVVGIVIDDPDYEGTELTEGHEFWRPHVVRNAGANASRPEHFSSLGRPFLPLARVRMPASTATVQDSYIDDLRFMAITRSHRVDFVGDASATGSNVDIGPSQTAWLDLPDFSGIQVPQWATRATANMTLTSAHSMNGRSMGQFRQALTGSQSTVFGAGTSFLEDAGLWTRFDVHAAGDFPLHASSRGGTCSLKAQIRRTNTSQHSGTIRIPDLNATRARLYGSITFEEAPRFSTPGA